MHELVSVIIPNYNKEIYIQQCIESVIGQTYRPIEIIVVDDCSTDHSLELLFEIAKKYKELKVVEQKTNAGVSAARNAGIAAATGRFVTFLDSDDYYYNPKKLANEMALINQGAGLAYSKIVRVDNNGKELERQFLDNKYYLQGSIAADTMIGKNMNTIPRDYIIAKELAVATGGYPEGINLYEDLLFLLKLLTRVEAKCTYDTGTAYRQDTNGLSKHPPIKKYRLRWKLCWQNRNIFGGLERISFIFEMFWTRAIFEAKTAMKRLIRR